MDPAMQKTHKTKATETHPLTSWDEFHPLIHEIRQCYGASTIELPDGASCSVENQLLFRGQGDSEWELQTTLERKSNKRFDVTQYLMAIKSCDNEFKSCTGKRWNNKSFPDLEQEINRVQDSMRVHLANYEYLVYLRHHGFPSPLLDWTASPNIAAYFAFCEQVRAESAAIYVYIEPRPKKMRGGYPMISVQGPHVDTHARHFAQKSWYTVATKWSYQHKVHLFCPHADVFCVPDRTQDLLIKITIPIAQRSHILRDLNDCNINHFTLFQSEDSLIKAVSTKCFDMSATG